MANNIQKKQKGTITNHSVSLYQGPLPQASEFAEYEKVLPGSADRILTMAEKNMDAETQIRKETLKAQSRDALLGMIFMFLTYACLFSGSIFLIYFGGKNLTGLSEVVTILAGLATFIGEVYSVYKNNKEQN